MGDINSALSHAPVMVMSAPRNASKSATPNSNTNKQATAANNGNKEITESNIVSHGSTSIIKKLTELVTKSN